MFQQSKIDINNYREGNVVYLRLNNFQTFKAQEFYFGNKLNLIAAPNGTGKSSIANSLAFIFDGGTKTIGKTKDTSDYIRFGTDRAEIECVIVQKITRLNYIEKEDEKRLKSGEYKYVTLKRIIEKNNKGVRNAYSLDGKSVSHDVYGSYIKAIGIDCNNLTTFLPQEKVAEFCKMKGKALFEEVFKSYKMDNYRVMAVVEKYYKAAEDVEELKTRMNSRSKAVNLLENKRTILKKEMDKLKEFEKNSREIRLLQYKEHYIRHEGQNNHKIHLENRIKELENNINNHKLEIKEKEMMIHKLSESPEAKEYFKVVNMIKTENKEINKITEDIKDTKREISAAEKELATKIEKNKKIQAENDEMSRNKTKHLNKAVEEYNKFIGLSGENKIDLNTQMQNRSYESVIQQIKYTPKQYKLNTAIIEQIDKLKHASGRIQRDIESLERDKLEYANATGRRLLKLKEFHYPTYQAVKALREKQIDVKYHEPLYLHLEIDKNYGKEIEACLDFQSVSSFLVENTDDIKRLSRILKDEMKLPVNICTISRNTNIRKFVFRDSSLIDGAAIEYVKCDDIYKSFLCQYRYLDIIPISKRDVNEKDIYRQYSFAKRIIVNNKLTDIKGNKYNSDVIYVTHIIRSNGLFSNDQLNKVNAVAIDAKIREHNKKREEIKIQLHEVYEKKKQEDEKQRLVEDADKHVRNIYFLVKRCIDAFYNCRQIELFDISDNKIRELKNTLVNKSKQICRIELHKMDTSKIKEIEVNIYHARQSIGNSRIQLDQSNRSMNMVENELRGVNDRCKNYKDLMDGMETEESVKMRELTKRMALTQEYYDICVIKDFPGEIKRLPNSLDEILTTKYKLEVINKHINKDERIREEFYKIEDDYRDVMKDKSEIEADIKNRSKKRDEIKDKITSFVHNALQPINERFKDSFNCFGYMGEIRLNMGEDNEILSFELNIYVSFDGSAKLEMLSATRQSGGEKALSTILFLLALGSDKCGFRLVDEINQGMDGKNEKKVFEVLKKMDSQFFIITPKLMDDMDTPINTKVLILYSGKNVKSLESL